MRNCNCGKWNSIRAKPYHERSIKSVEVAAPIMKYTDQGRNWVILRGVRLYICNRKVEIILGLSPSVKCVLPLLRDMPLAKV